MPVGRVVASFGRLYEVELESGQLLACTTRGKKKDVACGDEVALQVTNQEQAVIERILPRRSLLYRSDAYRQKLIAANVTQLLIVLAVVPSFSEELLNRSLIAAESAGIKAVIVLNKSDLPQTSVAYQQLKANYEKLGYSVVLISAKQTLAPLSPILAGQVSVLVGQSGMGKSTLINALVPDANTRTGEISQALSAGKHTTTYTRLYHLDAEADLIDSPGLQEFGLHHLDVLELAEALPEFRSYLGQCKFHNCRHLKEPGCAVLAASTVGEIALTRLQLYQKLAEIKLKAVRWT